MQIYTNLQDSKFFNSKEFLQRKGARQQNFLLQTPDNTGVTSPKHNEFHRQRRLSLYFLNSNLTGVSY